MCYTRIAAKRRKFAPGKPENGFGARGMTLNRKKTRVRTNAQRRRVTGLVVNERVRTDRDCRRALRQELYYCQKYGIEAHVTRKNIPGGAENYARSLLGRVTRALSFEAGDASLARTGVSRKLLNIGKLNIRKRGGMKQ